MAGEIKVTISATLTNPATGTSQSKLLREFRPGQKTYDQSTKRAHSSVVAVSTGATGEAIPMGDVSTPGWCFMTNLDTTNYVIVGSSASDFIIRIEAGESLAFRLNPSVAPRFKSVGGSCDVMLELWAD